MPSSTQTQPYTLLISTTQDGNLDSRFGTSAEDNLSTYLNHHHLHPHQLIRPEQVHACTVTKVNHLQAGHTIPASDGLITNDPEVILMLRLADCVPISIFDPITQSLALVHSGWRGTLGKIALVTIQQMNLEFNSRPSDLHITLGPSITASSNIWDHPPIQSHLPEWQPFIHLRRKLYHVDIPGFIHHTLIRAGVPDSQITKSSVDTATDPAYFSHHRSQHTNEPEGRFAVFAKLKPRSQSVANVASSTPNYH